MGCRQSKQAADGAKPQGDNGKMDVSLNDNLPPTGEKSDKLYKLLAKSQMAHSNTISAASNSNDEEDNAAQQQQQREHWAKVMECCRSDPRSALYQNPTTKSTPLHMAVRLIDSESGRNNNNKIDGLTELIHALVKANPKALAVRDAGGNIPLHYAIAPTAVFHPSSQGTHNPNHQRMMMSQWKLRAEIVRLLVASDTAISQAYMARNDVLFESGDSTGGCTPLYRVLQTLPDDFEPKGPTYQYLVVVTEASPHNMSGMGNQAEGDKPLALLYRRFTRQFDISEKFFAGDNSRSEVVEHRRQYKAAAGNTWKIIELLLRPKANELQAPKQQQSQSHQPSWRIVHRAVQVETPPDLLRYIVETNPEDLTQVDHKGQFAPSLCRRLQTTRSRRTYGGLLSCVLHEICRR